GSDEHGADTMTTVSRRSFLEAGAALAAVAPLTGAGAKTERPRDAVAAAADVADGKTTPAVLVADAIARLDRVNPLINAVSHTNYDRARRAAAASSGATGPFAGVPTLIKDNIEQAGLPWTAGSRALRNRIGVVDSPVAVAIARAGLISIGRSNLPEFGLLPTTEPLLSGPTRNPWRPDRSSGGSSGGSAAAVAAGVVAVAHGNDGGGSIRIPASCCGLVGLKPSRARMIGETGRSVTDLGVEGCLSRTVRDTAAWIAACEALGPDAVYPPVGLVTGPSGSKLRIGLQRASGLGRQPHADVGAVFDRSVRLLQRHGHRMVDAAPVYDGAAVAAAFETLWSAGAAARIKVATAALRRPPTARDVEPLSLSWAASGARSTEADIARSVAALQLLEKQYAAQFDRYDVLMTPVLGAPPVGIGTLAPTHSYAELADTLRDYVAYTPIENASGAPAISLPMGAAHDGLPIGLQFTTRPGGERILLELAYDLERELDWHRRHPPVWVGQL
ncbi:MAG: amidase, partial [Janthinobacterium lividum]